MHGTTTLRAGVLAPLWVLFVALPHTADAQEGGADDELADLTRAFELIGESTLEVTHRHYEMELELAESTIWVTEATTVRPIRGPVASVNLYLSDRVAEISSLQVAGDVSAVRYETAFEGEHLNTSIRILTVNFEPPLPSDGTAELLLTARLVNEALNPTFRVRPTGAQLIFGHPLLSERIPWAESGDLRHLRWSFDAIVNLPAGTDAVTTLPRSGDVLEGERRRIVFGTSSTPTYLSLLVGDISQRRIERDGVDIEVWTQNADPSPTVTVYAVVALVQAGLDYYTAWFGDVAMDAFRIVEYDNTVFGTESVGARGLSGAVWLPRSFLSTPLSEPWVQVRAGALDKTRMILHEVAHTWWIGSVGTYGPASWLITEGVCNFAAARAAGAVVSPEKERELFHGYRARWYEASEGEPPLTEISYSRNRSALPLAYNRGALALLAVDDATDGGMTATLGDIAHAYRDDEITCERFEDEVGERLGPEAGALLSALVREPGLARYQLVETRHLDDVLNVEIRNAGTAPVPAPLVVTSPSGTQRVWVAVPAGESRTFEVILPQGEAFELAIDPDRMRLVEGTDSL